MKNNGLNYIMEHQHRHQDMLRKAEHERRVNNAIRSRKHKKHNKRSFIARLRDWGASQLGGKPVVEREHVYASPSQKK